MTNRTGILGSLKGRLLAHSLRPMDGVLKLVGLRYSGVRWMFTSVRPRLLASLGRLRAERAAQRASERVPAYRAHIASAGARPVAFSDLPETDKRSYIDAYSLVDRCLDGAIPFRGTTIDESSGSTGQPYNWIRSSKERSVAHRNISFFARYCFGDGPLIVINAFSMGAWATGINMSLGLNRVGIVKSTGPDIDKVLSTLAYLGPSYRYLLCGYPPFLKHLLDEGARQSFDWSRYELHGIVGGEGMSEELRDVLLGRFQSVYSGYGATDLEIGMAAETPVSIVIRRLARANPELHQALFGDDSRLPMVFQYNPVMHHLEVNAHDEVLCTVSRLDLVSPRIRYNVHDQGGVAPFNDLLQILERFGIDRRALAREISTIFPGSSLVHARPLPLPFVWIHGRRDATVSIMGANIYPEDVERALYGDQQIAPVLHSYIMGVVSDDAGNPRPWIAIERTAATTAAESGAPERVRESLAAVNLDYRTALSEFPEVMLPIVEFFDIGEGPFAADAGRIKQRRVLAAPTSVG